MNKFNDIEIFGVGKVGPKGQVVIPSEARDKMSFEPGDKVVIVGLPSSGTVVIMSEDTFGQHLSSMRKHYETVSKYLSRQRRRSEKGQRQ